MNCPKCGKELVENAKFCTSCGYNLENANVTPPPAGNVNVTPPPAGNVNVTPPPAGNMNVTPHPAGNANAPQETSGTMSQGNGYGPQGMPGAARQGSGYGPQGTPGAAPQGSGYGPQGMPGGASQGSGYGPQGMPGGTSQGSGYGLQGMPGGASQGIGYGPQGMPGATPQGNGYVPQGMPGVAQPGNGYVPQGMPGAMPMGNGYMQQPVRQPNPVMQKMGKAFLDIFRNPVQAHAEMEKSSNAGPAFLILGIQAVLCGLLMMGLVGLTKDYSLDSYNDLNLLDLLNYFIASISSSFDNYAKVFIIGMFGAFGINMMTALWYFLFVGKLSKKQINFMNACSVTAIKGVVNVCLILVAMLFCAISPSIGSLFLFGSVVIGWFYMLMEAKPEAEYKNTLFFSKILVVTCSLFANSLFVFLLLKAIMG